MIPTNRPVLGKDLDSIAQQFGMLVSDACWLFGMSITKWMQIVRRQPDVPLKDPSLALLVRFLADHPELSVIPKYPSAEEMFAMVNKVQEFDQKRFSVLFGSEASATYRWLKPGSRMSPTVGRLMFYMKMAMLASSPEKRAQMLENWRETVKLEGQARGVDDIFKSGAWNPKTKRPPRKRAAAKKVVQ
jgi:hypothetical protein